MAEIARELDLPEPAAVALVRRGHRTVDAAKAFLAADEHYEPTEFDGIDRALRTIRGAIEAGRLITVHGDYDVDGVSATAILVRALRELGADCDWFIPGRVEDGYGLTRGTVERLAERGTGLIITVDCGITSVSEVEAARELGINVVVTDHHQPGEELPDCPIVHPLVSGYPCADLCAGGVAHKLASALRGVEDEGDLDLVAMATLADMVPLRGENRSLARRGLDRMRRSPRVGLRALMAVANVAPERASEGDVGFRLAPRINAAGRLYRADAAVELMLSDDPERSAEIATELDRANLDRRETEREVLAEANRLLADLEADREPGAGIVLWGEGWHPGVVGICASRMAERHGRPAILIAVDQGGRGKGSGRSVPGFDLLDGLRACGEHLTRFGGHRAAAGLEVEADRLEDFRAAFGDHCDDVLASGQVEKVEWIDAVVGAEGLGQGLAAELERLGPFGMGNPEVRLLVPGCEIADVRPMGDGERHARFLLSGSHSRARGVAFGVGGTLEGAAEMGPQDASVRLELNEWNGTVEPRIVLGSLYGSGGGPGPRDYRATQAEWEERFERALAGPIGFAGASGLHRRSTRTVIHRRFTSGLAVIAELASSCEPVLVVAADAMRRRRLVDEVLPPARFCEGEAAIVSARGSLERGVEAAEAVARCECGGVALADPFALAQAQHLPALFTHVVVADPLPHARVASLLAEGATEGSGFVHSLAAEEALINQVLAEEFPGREMLARAYRVVADGSAPLGLEDLRRDLCGDRSDARSPESCALAVRILTEMGVVRRTAGGGERSFEALTSVRGDLSNSMSFRSVRKAHEECLSFLSQPRTQSSNPSEAAA